MRRLIRFLKWFFQPVPPREMTEDDYWYWAIK